MTVSSGAFHFSWSSLRCFYTLIGVHLWSIKHLSWSSLRCFCTLIGVHLWSIQLASIILKWKTLGTTRTLPRAGRPAKLSNRGRRASVREVSTNLMVTLVELQRSCVEMGETSRRTTFHATHYGSGLYGRLARRQPLLSERHKKAP